MKKKPHWARRHVALRPLTEAERQTVLDNLGLAKKFAGRIAWAIVGAVSPRIRSQRLCDQFFDELYSAGICGLCVAAQRFDPTRGLKFSTLAWPWIRAYVHVASMQARLWAGQKYLERHPNFGAPRVIMFSEREQPHGDSLAGDHSPGLDVWDGADQDDGFDPGEAELHALLSLVLEPRQHEFIWQRVVEGRALGEIGHRHGISGERARQIFNRALSDLRDNETFMRALERRFWRRRQHLTAADFAGLNVGTSVA